MRKWMMAAVAMTTMTMTAQKMTYPQAAKDATVDEYFGTKVADPYRWLENDTSAQTAAWVKAENAVTDAYLKRLPQRKRLMKRLKEVSNYEKVGAPVEHHERWYFYRNDGLQNQSVLYVTEAPLPPEGGISEVPGTGCDIENYSRSPLLAPRSSKEYNARVFLDPNKLSDDGTVALKGVWFSNDGRYAAYAVSRSGSDWQEFYVIDVNTGQTLSDHVEWAKFSGAAWLGDGFFYSAYDAPVKGKEFSNMNEVQKIYYHRVGTPQSDDVLFYQNPTQPKRFYSVQVNEEETMMFLYESGEGNGNNLYVRDLRQEGSQFIQMTDGMEYQYAPIDDDGNRIFILTNDGAPKNRLMVADISRPGVSDWQELIAEGEYMLESADAVNHRLVLTYNVDAANRAYVYSMEGERLREVELPGVGSVSFVGKKNQRECFFQYTSFTVPGTIYELDTETGRSSLQTAPRVNFNLNDYETRQLFFESKDGTRVPMYITYKKGLKQNGQNPVCLYGYGGFNIALGPSFSAMRIPFLEQGGIYAQVNLRGGSEYGEAWHQAGTKMQKQNVFDDFISAAEYLIGEGYTKPEKMAIMGGSNGGLLVGACMTQRPDLFAVAIPQVGVMDMLRYHRFTIGWNWAPDYGTSADSKEMFEYLLGYSPLHNLRQGVSYPATLVTTADHDDRVVPAHSFKFAATLQECQGGEKPTLIRIDTKAGHGGGKPLGKVIEEQADIYGFIMKNLGMK